MVSIFDVVLILFLGGFVFYGLFKGLIKLLGDVIGLIVGAWAASHYYLVAYNWLKWLYFGQENLGKVISFVIVLLVAIRLVGWLFILLQKVFDIMSIIPFLKSINKLAGGILGLIEGISVLGLIIYMASRYSFVTSFFGAQLASSQIAPLLAQAVSILTPLFPTALKMLQSLI